MEPMEPDVDTLTETVPPPGDAHPTAETSGEPPPDGVPPSRRRVKKRWWVLGGFLVVLVLAVLSAAFVSVPYYLLAPGSVRDTKDLISVEGAPSFEDAGEVNYATVSLQHARALQALIGWIDPNVDVVDEKLILGDQSPQENRQENLQEMTDSKQIATAVGLERLGYQVTETGSGALVMSVVNDVPAAAVLSPGDVIVEADGQPVQLADQLVAAIGAHQPGETIDLKVQPADGGDPKPVSVELVARPDDPSKAMLGVSTATHDLEFDYPFEVSIDSGAVGGPSAGLAFTLGVMDRLTPESLTGGQKVATTGTMDLQGRVGPVGGVHQKTVAVRDAGATLFLVPSSEADEARQYAGNMRVEPVDTLEDALKVLASVGGGTSVVLPPPALPSPGS